MVEVKQTSDQFLPEQTEGVLQVKSPVHLLQLCLSVSVSRSWCSVSVSQVNELTWSDLAPDEEEDDEEWDLTVS